MTSAEKPPIDNPIRSSADDVLDRAEVAHDFARTIRDLDASEGVVVGVLGPWGNGKSSFIAMMKEEFLVAPALHVIDFNPWLFSGSQQLTDVFFKEIAAELRLSGDSRLEKIASGLDDYGDLLGPLAMIPYFGAWWDRTFKAGRALLAFANKRKEGSRPLRQRVTNELAAVPAPIVVVIDDIDRLTTAEIRDIFKLVRLTASFPNVIYVLAFDRHRVEQALSEDGTPGRAYLEKIIQLGFDLPAIPREVLRRIALEELNRILGDIAPLRFDQAVWADVYFEIIEPLLGNLRDVTRLALSARPTLLALGSEIEVVDILALESLRVFRPEVFMAIQEAREALTAPTDAFGGQTDPRRKALIEALVAAAEPQPEIATSLVKRIFPAGRRYIENTHYGHEWLATWRKAHRVAHPDFLSLYLDRMAPTGLAAFRQAEHVMAVMNDPVLLVEYLDSLPPEDLEDVIEALETYDGSFSSDMVIPGSIALLNLIGAIPERRSRGMFDLNRPDMVVSRVVLRLVRTIEDEASREAAVREMMTGLHSFSSRLELIRIVGVRESEGHGLVSSQTASALEDQFVDDLGSTDMESLANEWNLLRVLYFTNEKRPGFLPLKNPVGPGLAKAIFASARSTSRSGPMDSRTITETDVLDWRALGEVFGTDDEISAAAESLRTVDPDQSVLSLVDAYLSGWRPPEW